MKFKFLKLFFVFFLIVFLVFSNFKGLAMTPQEERQALEKELKELEDLISKYEKDIGKTEQEKKTLQNQINTLKTKIKKLDLQIAQSSVLIKDIGIQIKDTEGSIEKTTLKIEESKERLADILREINEEDQNTLMEILLSEDDLSGFFNNLVALETLNIKNQELLRDIKNLKLSLEGQRQSLDSEKGDLEKMRQIQMLQKNESETLKKEKDYSLQITEAEYQKSLQEKMAVEKRAAEIRTRIFELVGVPKAPTFGEAYEIAKYVEGITGVRPAFLLAVLTQESNIGKNVGQCYVTNLQTGAGVNIRTGASVNNVMKPMGLSGRKGDTNDFLSITSELGRKWNETPVSCPMPSVGGYGGAMGPAQFIPTTWVLYKDNVKAITGKPADPWNIKDAFLAAALLLSDSGAANKTYNSEWRAAMIYFSGGTNSKYRFYGDSVMNIASRYEEDIKQLEAAR